MSRLHLTQILLPADPTAALEAATKQYVDAKAGYGTLTVINDPNLNTQTTPGLYLCHKVSTGPTNGPPGATTPTDTVLIVQRETVNNACIQTFLTVAGDEVWQRQWTSGIWLNAWAPLAYRPASFGGDINTLVENGVYNLSGAHTNGPLAEQAILTVSKVGAGQPMVTQVWTGNSTYRQFWRVRNASSAWQAWCENLKDSANLPRGLIARSDPGITAGPISIVNGTGLQQVAQVTSVNLVAGRWYLIGCAARALDVAVAPGVQWNFVLVDGVLADAANSAKWRMDSYNGAANSASYDWFHDQAIVQGDGAVHSFTLTCRHGAASPKSIYQGRIWIEDLGGTSPSVQAPFTPWTACTLQNGATAYGGGFQIPGYRLVGDKVELRGLVKLNSTNWPQNQPMFTLPVGYRPPLTLRFIASGIANSSQTVDTGNPLECKPDGTVQPTNLGMASYVFLDGVHWSITA